jgi:hypothetical protein
VNFGIMAKKKLRDFFGGENSQKMENKLPKLLKP